MIRVLLAALTATLAVASISAGSPSPWTIKTVWTKQLPNTSVWALDMSGFAVVNRIYYATSSDAKLYAVNTSTHEIAWSRHSSDILFIQPLLALNAILVGRSQSTLLITASGVVLWNTNVTILPDLTNHGDRNFITVGHALIYRDTTTGFTKVCALNYNDGTKMWCSADRTVSLPDAAPNGTITVPMYDSKGNQYIANFDAYTGMMKWRRSVTNVLTGSVNYVAVVNGSMLISLNSTDGTQIASLDLGVTGLTGTAVIVHGNILAFTNGLTYVAAMDLNSGKLRWNTSVTGGSVQLQRRGNDLVVAATLSSKSTNFTRFDSYGGDVMWTVTARPVSFTNNPVHAWLGDDIIYVRQITDTWAAYGADTGDLIATGSGNLFIPRSSEANPYEPHVGYFVTGPEGIVYGLKIVPKF